MRANPFIPGIGNLNSLLTQAIRSPFMCTCLVVKSAKSSRKARQGFSSCACARRSFLSLLLCNRLAHFWHAEDRASWYILIIKSTRCTNFQIYFWNRTLHISDRFSVHHQQSSTVHTAICICHTGYADHLLGESVWNQFHPDPASKQSA